MTRATGALPALTVHVTERDAIEWAQLLDDDNPLHADPAAISAHGAGHGIVNPGPANMGYLMTLLLQSFPAASLEAFEARFVGLVLAPAKVDARITAQREESTPNGRLVHCELELLCANAITVTAKARLRIAPDVTGESL